MKKIAYLLIAVTIIGGAAYVLTQTSFLSGNLYHQAVVDNPTTSQLGGKNITSDQLGGSTGDIAQQAEDPKGSDDTDGDGLTNAQERKVGTKIKNPDSDGDGLSDGNEIAIETNPLEKDTDGGGTDDGTEVKAGTDPSDKSDDVKESSTKDGVNTEVLNPNLDGTSHIKDESTTSTDSEYACSELNITPDTFTLSNGEDVDFHVKIDIKNRTASVFKTNFGAADLMAFTITNHRGQNGQGQGQNSNEDTTDSHTAVPQDTNTESTSTNEDTTDSHTAVPSQDTSVEPTGTSNEENKDNSSLVSSWKGTLVIESKRTVEEKGTFINPLTGVSARRIKLELKEKDYGLNPNLEIIYSGGSVGDTISAYIVEEANLCNDSLELKANPKAEDKEQDTQTSAPTCELVDIQPDSYLLPNGESSVDFKVKVDSTSNTYKKVAAFIMNALSYNLVDLASEDPWSGTLVLTSSNGASIFFNDVNKLKVNPEKIPVSGESSTVNATLKDAKAGDIITAYIDGEENCKDTLTLQAKDFNNDENSSQKSEQTTQTDNTDQSSNQSGNDSNADSIDTILASKDYVCSEPFNDANQTDWFWGKICRLYRADVVTGIDSDTAGPEENLTRAQAIKILMILSGKDGTGSTEHFNDVSPSDWYYQYYVAAENAGIVHGTYANPNTPITRGDLMVYMVRTAGQTLYGWDESDIPFKDLKKSDYYTYAIIIGYNTFVDDPDTGTTRVFGGYPDGTSGATKYIARSEAFKLALDFYLAWYAK